MLREIEAMRPPKADPDRAESPSRAQLERPPAPGIPVAGAAEVAAHLERLLAQCRRQRCGFALLCVGVECIEGGDGPVSPDVEHRIRDEVARRMQSRIRATDRLLRESDRDACVVLPGGSDDAAQKVAERFIRVLNGAYRVDGDLVRVAVRVGFAVHPLHGASSTEMLARAAEGR